MTGAAAARAPPIAGTTVPVNSPPRLPRLDTIPRPFIAEIIGAIFEIATNSAPTAMIAV